MARSLSTHTVRRRHNFLCKDTAVCTHLCRTGTDTGRFDELPQTFAGHGKSINDIAVHPARPHLFLTASEDESVRLWNLRCGGP